MSNKMKSIESVTIAGFTSGTDFGWEELTQDVLDNVSCELSGQIEDKIINSKTIQVQTSSYKQLKVKISLTVEVEEL